MGDDLKKLCMIVHAYYPLRETRVQREAEALIEKGYEVDVLCLRYKDELFREEINGVHVVRLPVRRHKGRGLLIQFIEYLSFLLWAFLLVSSRYFKRRYSIIHVHNLPDFLVFAAMIPRFFGAKVILDLHDLMPEFFASRFKCGMNNLRVKLVKWQEKISCLFAHHVITVTELWRQNLIQRGIPPSKCSVVMNVADDRHFKPDIFSLSSQKDVPFRLLYHGVVTYHNGTDIILKALSMLSNELPGIFLTIHGSGDYLKTLQSLTHELKLDDYIRFSLDFVPMKDLPSLIAGNDIGIVPIRRDIFTNGILPTKLMEYAALGMPAIASRTSAIASYFDETMLEFFEPGDAAALARCIQTLYYDRPKCEVLSSNIQKFSQNHNWSTQKKGYIRLIQDLVKI